MLSIDQGEGEDSMKDNSHKDYVLVKRNEECHVVGVSLDKSSSSLAPTIACQVLSSLKCFPFSIRSLSSCTILAPLATVVLRFFKYKPAIPALGPMPVQRSRPRTSLVSLPVPKRKVTTVRQDQGRSLPEMYHDAVRLFRVQVRTHSQ